MDAPTQSSNGNTTPATTDATRPAGGPALARVVQGAHDAVDSAAAKVAPVIDGVQSKVDGARNAVQSAKDSVAGGKQALQDNLDKLVDTKDEWIGAARDTIRTHPFAAVATALLVGAAYISLGSRRR